MRWLFCVAWRVKGGGLWGRGLRIATASVRTGLAMTGFPWSVVHGRRATARVAPTEGCKKCGGAGRCRHRPLRKHYKGCNGRATARVAPTKALQGVRCGEESPSHGFAVPAPFRQGGHGDGGTDCHGQCSHWPRNDIVFSWGCGVRRADRGVRPYENVETLA